MSKWEITKSFSGCYGHRVWNQQLNSEYSIDNKLVCRHLHGHEALINVTLEGEILEKGMVTDFKHLGWFKKFVDEVIDHKFIFDLNDPLLKYEIPILFSEQGNLDSIKLQINNQLYYSTIKPEVFESLSKPLQEKYEGFIFVTFVPTSENLAKWCFDVVNDKMKLIGVKTKSVEFYETPKSRSLYIGE